jgi:hypothetical protein
MKENSCSLVTQMVYEAMMAGRAAADLGPSTQLAFYCHRILPSPSCPWPSQGRDPEAYQRLAGAITSRSCGCVDDSDGRERMPVTVQARQTRRHMGSAARDWMPRIP